MIRHCVLLTWKPETTDEQVQDLIDALAGLPELIPELKSYKLGRDLALSDGNATLGITADFDDIGGWRAYTDHVTHQQIIVEKIRPIMASRTACQFEL